MSTNRREVINLYIQSKGEVRLLELENLLPDISSMTIRRDLENLEQRGEIVRTRGGAKSISHLSMLKEAAYTQRVGENTEAKMIIAEKATKFVTVGRSLYIDAGTTGMYFAQKLNDDNLFVLTSAPNIAMELIKNHNIKVSLTGGQLNRDTLSLSGYNAAEYIKTINIDIAFMAASAFSLNSGFTCGDYFEAEIKRLIIKKAQTTVMLMDASKVECGMPYTFAKLTDVDILITDTPLAANYLKAAKQARVTVI
ncbi:MAG: DeoR/GlpR family DNA-binding transcription regulator [Saccharofermentanales bacterium]